MGLTFPQHITVHNARLKYFYYSLAFSLLATLIFRFCYQELYLKELNARGDVLMWVSGYHDLDLLTKISAEKSTEPFCSKPEQFDYWYNVDGATHFENHTCIPMCHAGSAQAGCLTQWETFVPEGSSQVFLTTQFQEALLLPDGNETSGALSHYFVPVTEALSVSLTYSYRLPDLHWLTTSADSTNTVIDSRVDVTTVVMTSEGVENLTFEPGADIALTVEELLNLAGKSLDAIESNAGANRLEGAAYPEGALARISGMELLVDVECFQGQFRACGESVQGNVCCLVVSSTWAAWQSIATHDVLNEEGALRYRLYHGVRIKAKAGGLFKKVDPNSIYLYLCSMVVLMQFPKKVVLLVACTLLGHTSKIYRNVIFRKFSITKECGGMAMRLMGNNQAFTRLEDATRLDTRGISRSRIRRELKTLLTRRGCLDKAEIDQMVHFCHNATVQERGKVSSPQIESSTSVRRFVKTLVREASHEIAKEVKELREVIGETGSKGKEEGVGVDMPVDIDSFLVACSSAEPIDFESFVKLFDRDRRQFFFERFFMPAKLKNCLDKSKEDTRANSDDDEEEDEEDITDDHEDEYDFHSPRSGVSRQTSGVSARGEATFMTRAEGNSLMSSARRLKDQADRNSLMLGQIEQQLANAPALTAAANAALHSGTEEKLLAENAQLAERISSLEELVRSYSADAENRNARSMPAAPQQAFSANESRRQSQSTPIASEFPSRTPTAKASQPTPIANEVSSRTPTANEVRSRDKNAEQVRSQLMQAFYENLTPMTSAPGTRAPSKAPSGAATPTKSSRVLHSDLCNSHTNSDSCGMEPGALERRVMEQVWWLQNEQREVDATVLREAMARVLALHLVPIGTGLEDAACASAIAMLGQVRSLVARLRRDGLDEGASNVEALAASMAENIASKAALGEASAATTNPDSQAARLWTSAQV